MKIITDEMDIRPKVSIKTLVEIATKEEYPSMSGSGAQSIFCMLKKADPSGNIYLQGLHAATAWKMRRMIIKVNL